MDKSIDNSTSRWPHRVALLLAAIVFPLIWMGGLVTTSDAGMAVPDWPNTYNFNMFAYPIRDWFFGPWDLFVEHGHRLLGSLAGIVAIVLVICSFVTKQNAFVKMFAIALLASVCVQGALGGARVLMDERTLAKIHGCLGPACFAAVIGFCVVTSRRWAGLNVGHGMTRRPRWLSGFAMLMLAASFFQLVLGAFLRHIAADAGPTTMLALVAGHVTMAIALVFGTLIHFFRVQFATPKVAGLKGSIQVLMLLILVQFGLGLTTWVVKYGWPIWFEDWSYAANYVIAEKTFWQVNLVTMHVAVGSLILAFWTVHTLRCMRVLSSIEPSSVKQQQIDLGSAKPDSLATENNDSLSKAGI